MEEKSPIVKLLTPKGKGENGFIPLNRNLVASLGLYSAIIAIELATKQEFYKKVNRLNKFGEFYYTVECLEEATGVKSKAQSAAIKDLKTKEFILSVKNRNTPQKRYFLLSPNLEELFKLHIEKGKEKLSKTNPVDVDISTNEPNLKTAQKQFLNCPKEVLNVPKSSSNSAQKHLNKNNSKNKIENNKQDKECLSVPLKVKDKEYLTLLDKLMDIFPNKTKEQIEVKVDRILKVGEFTCEDLNLGFDYKNEKGTIEFLMKGKSGEKQFNTILSSIKLGVTEAKSEEIENNSTYEHLEPTTADIQDSILISEKEHNLKISTESRKQLDFLKEVSIEQCIRMFNSNIEAREKYKTILEPFKEENVLVERYTKNHMLKFYSLYKEINQI